MQVTTIGLDIAKNVFQVHGIDAAEKVVVRKQFRRSQVLEFFKALPSCLQQRQHDQSCPAGDHDGRAVVTPLAGTRSMNQTPEPNTFAPLGLRTRQQTAPFTLLETFE